MNDNKNHTKESLFGKTHGELLNIIKEAGLPAFTARQLSEWLYSHKTDKIDDMTNLSKKARLYLNSVYKVGKQAPVNVMKSSDGTKKYLFTAGDGHFIESAYIPDKNRHTLCLSSQIGCKMGCHFCMTGKQGFQGQLTAGEILNQLVSIDETDSITNLVYMGMGEPFDNTEAVIKSIEILTSEWGFAMSPRRITVSTIGMIDGIRRFLTETEAHLAVSMHTPFDNERKELMPVENAHPMAEVIKEIKSHDWSGQRRVSFEYIMFKNFNDSEEHINKLVSMLGDLRCRLNLIRFHPVPGLPYESSSDEIITGFRDKLSARGITTTIRASRGEDIMAACGLLSTKRLSD